MGDLEKNKIEKYSLVLGHAEYCADQTWQIFQWFLISHTIFIAFLSQAIFSNSNKNDSEKLILGAVLFLGIVTCFIWFAVYQRTRAYYVFRLAQAKEIEPSNLKLLKNRGEDFAEGKIVEIDKSYRMPFFARARISRIRFSIPSYIALFMFLYLWIMGVTFSAEIISLVNMLKSFLKINIVVNMDWKFFSEVFYNFAVGFGAIGGGLFAVLKFVTNLITKRKQDFYKDNLRKLYPREKIGKKFKIVDTEQAPGKLYILDFKKKERYWIQSADTLLDLNFFWDDSVRVSSEEFSQYKEGPTILTSGTPGS